MQDLITHDNLSGITGFSQNDLSIQAGMDGLTFFVRKGDSGEIEIQQHFSFFTDKNNLLLRKIREITETREILRQTFRTTTVFFSERNFTLIPEPFFSEKLANHPFSLKQKVTDERETVVLPLHYMNAVLVFSTGKNLTGFFSETFPGCLITHEVSPVILHLKNNHPSAISFLLHSSWFYSIVMIDGKIDMANTFEYRNEADLIFYILNVVNHYEISDIPVFISGWDEDTAGKFQLIRKYITHAEEFHCYL